MPLNDLRDWTDADLSSLRERYTRALTKAGATTPYGTYAGNPTPYLNAEISEFGYKYWKTGSYATPAPSTAAKNWYDNIVRHGLLKPYVLFDLQLPRPGWWQHTGQLVQRLETNPHHTFFTHPNGAWAFFSQDFIYAGKITDDSATVNLADMKIQFVPGTIADPYDPSITYAQMRVNWPTGYSAYYRELGYFSGTKSSNFDVRMLGGALDLSLSALWKITPPDSSLLTAPCSVHTPVTFSTCVLITK
jgi:hypothetical protein